MLRRLNLLPWPDIFWSAILASLGLMVLCPLLALSFWALGGGGAISGTLMGGVLPLLCGIAGGVAARIAFDRVFKQVMNNGSGWAIVLCLVATAYPLSWAVGTALQALPRLLGLEVDTSNPILLISQLLLAATPALFDLVFIVGAAMGMFWRAIRIGR